MNKEKITAVELLEILQKAYLDKYGIDSENNLLNNDEVIDAIKTFIGQDISSISDIEYIYQGKPIALCTKYQSKNTYYILVNIVSRLNNVIDTVIESPYPKMPVFGSVFSEKFSAEICCNNCEDKLIVISNGLFVTANLISKIFLQCFKLECKQNSVKLIINDEITKQLVDNYELKLKFYDLMLSFIFTNGGLRTKSYFVDSEYNPFLVTLLNSYETFVVGHEYGHALLGHLDNASGFNIMDLNDSNNSNLLELYHNQEQELEADIIGSVLTISAMESEGIDNEMSFIGIKLCIKTLELLEKAIEMKDEINRRIDDHPKANIREKNIEKFFMINMKNGLMSKVDYIFDFLFEKFQNFFEKFKSNFERDFKRNIYQVPFKIVQDYLYENVDYFLK